MEHVLSPVSRCREGWSTQHETLVTDAKYESTPETSSLSDNCSDSSMETTTDSSMETSSDGDVDIFMVHYYV